ncbi:MAG: YbgA family protein [Pseudomonadales bacterium]
MVITTDTKSTEALTRLKVGISACLAGQNVRYDGASKRFKQRKAMEEFVDFQPYCPEMAIGLGVPRKTLRLVGDVEKPSIVEGSGTLDVTSKLTDYANSVADVLQRDDNLSGFIVCKGSPSCGMAGVKRYNETGGVLGHDASGIFTAQLMRRLPTLPVEEDGRLNDKGLMESFLTRAHVKQRWQVMLKAGLTAKSLLAFHSEHKFLLLAHNQNMYRTLGKLLADLSSKSLEDLSVEYFSAFMKAMNQVPTAGQHANVLMHLQGYVKDSLSERERAELASVILDYSNGRLPRQAPMTLIKHHLANNPNLWAQSQHYLEPFSRDMLVLVER